MKIVTPRTRKDAKRNWFSLYECTCGRQFETRDFMVRSGRTRSCGCLKDKLTGERFAAMNYKHGQTRSPAWRSWNAMMRRCKYPSMNCYRSYGGRGIVVCKRWQTFANFLKDMGERPAGHSLDRIDNDGNYTPKNCRWLPVRENVRHPSRKGSRNELQQPDQCRAHRQRQ